MLDIKVIRENPDAVRAGALKKRFPERAEAVDRVLAVDSELRGLIPEIDGMRSAQKAAARQLAGLSPQQREEHLAAQKSLKQELQQLEERERELRAALRQHLLQVPSMPAPEVPDGADGDDNVEVRRTGEPPVFDFELRPHHELAEAQGWLDIQRAGQIAGSRNYYLMGDLAVLQDAALRFASDHMIDKHLILFCFRFNRWNHNLAP